MTKRRLLITALALVAIAVAVPVVPWAIVEWHVREIAADRQALLDALEAPEGSWEWRAVEEYAATPVGEETLRREFALLMGHHGAWLMESTFPKEELAGLGGPFLDPRSPIGDWAVYVYWQSDRHFLFGARSTSGEKTVLMMAPKRMRRLPDSSHGEDDSHATILARLDGLVAPSTIPIATSPDRGVYVLRLSAPEVPKTARAELFEASNPLAVFVKLWEPRGIPAGHLNKQGMWTSKW